MSAEQYGARLLEDVQEESLEQVSPDPLSGGELLRFLAWWRERNPGLLPTTLS